MRDTVEQSANKLDKQRVKLGVKSEEIIREQEWIIDTASKHIGRINNELRGLKKRLEPYVSNKPKERDEKYFNLKDRYEQALNDRMSLERAIVMAEESITAAKLHTIPGEHNREGV